MASTGLIPEMNPNRPEHDACGVGFVADLRGRASRDLVDDALTVLTRLEHRGAAGSDPETGDGAGILLQLPHDLLSDAARDADVGLPEPGAYALAQIFLDDPDDEAALALILSEHGLVVRLRRPVPTDPTAVGPQGRASMPTILQLVVVGSLPTTSGDGPSPFERRLYVARRAIEKALPGVHLCSLSPHTVVYKGLLLPSRLRAFYPDLADPRLRSALAVVHQRFSTNTAPAWRRAHPFRHVAHNGEINTLQGNLSRMGAREPQFASERFDEAEFDTLRPVLDPQDSDSANLDKALELLLHTGRSLTHSMAMLLPDAWERRSTLSASRRAFAAWHSAVMEPWDGPACVVFTDGRTVGAALDRNGLRPSRWVVTRSGRVVLSSEAGVLDLPGEEIRRRGRLRPGTMLLVDPARGRLLKDEEIRGALAHRQPYRRWLGDGRVRLRALDPDTVAPPPREPEARRRDQLVFGMDREDLKMLLHPMARTGKEPVGAMGDDTPLAVLSEKPRLLFDSFKQRFAQVTNPPIDPIREQLVMSLRVSLGAEGNLFAEGPEHCRQLELDAPVITAEGLERIRQAEHPGIRATTLDMLFPAVRGRTPLPDAPGPDWLEPAGRALERALGALCAGAEAAIRGGATLLVLSDQAHDAARAPMPSLLATSAVQNHLLRVGLRGRAGLVVCSGEVRETHHAALLLGYGAGAIVPWLALETVDATGDPQARVRYLGGMHRGLYKILSKMGISTLESYRGAQLFEAVGLDLDLVARYFAGTPSRLGGADLGVIAGEALLRHRDAWGPAEPELPTGGRYQWRRDGAAHAWNPLTVGRLQHAVRSGSYERFQSFAAEADALSSSRHTLRALLELAPDRPAIPLDEVESERAIVRRFRTGAMSYGSLSREAHETLAVAMNSLGARSNSGEGGEADERAGTHARSAIRQVASGRFGVTPWYLNGADELQIKMAQGAKPGEGGQLPGHKVDDEIARVRHSTPGVTLISPPPHHDIYSIEDLHQLIFDLKQANDRASVSVKLVATHGVGTIAAGVAKAGADGILISGRSGGTGASPLSSIRHTGLPWELGIAEAQHSLRDHGLRDQVTLEVDGHLKTGRDVIIAALLGAERFGFGTAALVASGCVLMRVCHKNTCPVGVATQDPELRALFPGQPEHVANFMLFVARQVRELLASLGARTLDEIVGRTDLLEPHLPAGLWKAGSLDLRPLLRDDTPGAPRRAASGLPIHSLPGGWLNEMLMKQSEAAVSTGVPVSLDLPILNVDRAVGTALSSAIVRQHGPGGLPPDTIRVTLAGVAGQSLGAFLAPGVRIDVVGGANDAVGKGMAGGSISIAPPEGLAPGADEALIGNVALYGATGGRLFVRGPAGERFAVRNSGAEAVVEGLGDHGCEYMTGGAVLVLGPTGRNFGAGMSGGVAWVLDRDGFFRTRCNTDVRVCAPTEADLTRIWSLLEEHRDRTRSDIAHRVLIAWSNWSQLLVRVEPIAAPVRPKLSPAEQPSAAGRPAADREVS